MADGDPASDVLATQSLFLPQDAGVPGPVQAQLISLLGEAERSRYPIRVAIVASPSDLGSVSALWRQPQTYSRFLGRELALVFHGPLLVAMPNGFGLYVPGGTRPEQPPALAGVTPGTAGSALASATIEAVRRVAAAAGHRLPVPTSSTPVKAGSGSVVPWLVFALGLALVVLAWSASLRARPLGASGRELPPAA